MNKAKINTYSVKEALLPTGDGKHQQRWYIYNDLLPVDAMNRYIHRKSSTSPKTGKTYAYHLMSWLNFLELRGKEYFEGDRSDIDAFKDYLAYGMYSHKKVLSLNGEITYNTLYGALIAIQGFYRWLEDHVDVFVSPKAPKMRKFRSRRKAKESFLYGQIFEIDLEEYIDIDEMRLKPSGHKKHWLTESEKVRILTAFRTVRDRAMFMLLCEGMRIDEVVSTKYSAYNSRELTVIPSRSKGYGEEYEDKFRTIAFHDKRTAEFIDQYIRTERTDVESALDDYLVPLFVNMKNHPTCYGKEVGYRNWWGVLKTAVKRAGLDPDVISTHVGRRSFVQEKLEEGEDPEIIRQMVGWANLEPLDKYRNLRSKVVIKNAAEKRRSKWDKTTPLSEVENHV
jgi:site-specific recombinase XerD